LGGLAGSPGGPGGPKAGPFPPPPADWRRAEPVPLGAPAVYRNLRRWLASIGIELGSGNGHVPVEVAKPVLVADPAEVLVRS